MKKEDKVKLFTDGGARGNPGPAAAAYVVKNSAAETLVEGGKYLGIATNNQAEYEALYMGLEKVREMGVPEVMVFMDSELIIKQLQREYKVKNKELAILFVKVWNILSQFKKTSFTHVPREMNKEADGLVNIILDR
ncbi:MAG: ribonuclease HI family protein, partial [Candidatus Komeilibacteria bacterium]|nr:ribonuclease HI family protein [Candidatus Komeilibacteria bacterium]